MLLPLLAFEKVSKRYPDGGRELVVLDRVSFEIHAGVFVGVFGTRRSGKSTLLRLAAGIETPTAGTVRFAGRDVAEMSAVERERLLRRGVALMSPLDWSPSPNERVIDQVALSLGSDGPALREARHRARRVLARVGATSCADELARSLSLVERARVILARALIRGPSVLLVDEPAIIPSLIERDRFCELLRSVAHEQNMTLVVASEEPAPLHGAGVLLSIGDGELCSTDERATVVPLPRRNAARSEWSGR
ncbi:MAG: ATP-binding cassette domain-containing protein [Solirubrobacteraceae bacterium]